MDNDKFQVRLSSLLEDYVSNISETRSLLRFFMKYLYFDRKGSRVCSVYTQLKKLVHSRFNVEVRQIPNENIKSVDTKEFAHKIYEKILSNFDIGKRIICFYCHFGNAKAEFRCLKASVRKLKQARRIFVKIMQDIGTNDIKYEGTSLNLPRFEPMREKAYKKNVDVDEIRKLEDSAAQPLAVSLGEKIQHSLVIANQLQKRLKGSKRMSRQAKRIAKSFASARGQLFSMFPTCPTHISKFESPTFCDILSGICLLEQDITSTLELCVHLNQESLFICIDVVFSKILRIKKILRTAQRQVKGLKKMENYSLQNPEDDSAE